MNIGKETQVGEIIFENDFFALAKCDRGNETSFYVLRKDKDGNLYYPAFSPGTTKLNVEHKQP